MRPLLVSMEYKKFIELTKNEGASQTYDTPSFAMSEEIYEPSIWI